MLSFIRPFKTSYYWITALSLCLLLLSGCKKALDQTADSPETSETIIVPASNVRPCSVVLEINDKWYSGEEILLDSINGTYYFSPVSIAPYLGVTVKNAGNGSYSWDDQIISADEIAFKTIKYQDLLYISEDFLRENLNINIYNHDSEIYMDNYPTLDYSWTKYRTVLHAGGVKDGVKYTNSREAIESNYEDGCRLFEMDFRLTSDGIPICGHDWKTIYDFMQIPPVKNTKSRNSKTTDESFEDSLYPALSYEEFKAHQNDHELVFTPMSYEELVQFMHTHPDVYIITDTKDTQDPGISDMFRQFVLIAKKYDPTVLDRLIPQIYNNEMGDLIWNIYDWKSVIYTFYNQGAEFRYDSVYEYARAHGIKVFTTYYHRDDMMFINPIVDRGGWIYMHTFNKLEAAMEFIETKRVYGIYTDYLPYDCLDEIPYPYP